MAIASAVLKAVNSSLTALRGRVQSVQQAITHLGTRENAQCLRDGMTRGAPAGAPELEPCGSAPACAACMSRIGVPERRTWAEHRRTVRGMRKAVLFSPCVGRAIRTLLRDAADDEEVVLLSKRNSE